MKNHNGTKPLTPEEASKLGEEYMKLLSCAAMAAQRRTELETALEGTKKEQAMFTEHLNKMKPMLDRAKACFV